MYQVTASRTPPDPPNSVLFSVLFVCFHNPRNRVSAAYSHTGNTPVEKYPPPSSHQLLTAPPLGVEPHEPLPWSMLS